MKKLFIFDTNVLLHEPTSLFDFADNTVVIPIVVVEEMDTFKKREDQVGRNSREASRFLDEMREGGNLHEGVKLPTGGMLRVAIEHLDLKELPPGFSEAKPDNRILALALHYQKTKSEPVILVTKDLNLRVKADSLGIKAVDYDKNRVDPEMLYTGHRDVLVPPSNLDSFFKHGQMDANGAGEQTPPFYANEFVMLSDETNLSRTALARVSSDGKRLSKIRDKTSTWGIIPRNREQLFAMDILLDDTIKLITLVGMAGTGKTLLALAAGLQMVVRHERYKKFIVAKPLIPMGKDIGYLPGDVEEKLLPRMQSINDNLEFLFESMAAVDVGASDLQELVESGVVEIQALTYIRGRSLPDVYMIVDEAQNLTPHEVKTIITRAGVGTKIILTGDLAQIDNPYVDASSNGLAVLVEKMKGQSLFGHVRFLKGERSDLAELAAQIL